MTDPRRLYLGVDGGGTKTDFTCIDAEGQVVAHHRGPTSYHLQIGLEAVLAVLEEGVAAVTASLGVTANDLDHVFFGLPAFDEDSLVDPLLEQGCRRLIGHHRVRCGNDMISGWAGSLGGQDGINIVAGTGSIGYGERGGSAARSGGWGEVFGDEGSGYWIAVRGLNAFSRMSDGRLPKGILHGRMRDALDLTGDLDLCARIMGERGLGRDGIGALSLVVADAAEAGDGQARAILEQAGRELAGIAVALRRQLGFGRDEVVQTSWSGSVLRRNAIVRSTFERTLGDSPERYAPVEPLFTPDYGAALAARRYSASASASDPPSPVVARHRSGS